MLFNSVEFLVFFPVFLVLYLGTRGRLRLWLTLLASYWFYASWDWRLLPLLWFQTGLDFYVGRWLGRVSDPRVRFRLIAGSLVTNLCLLGFFKYFHFAIDSVRALLASLGVPTPEVGLHVVLPVGISFYTFQTMSYAIDVYRREVPPEQSLLRFATSVALFVHLVAGPIVRARHLLPQLHSDRIFDAARATEGFEQLLWGFFKKVVVADSLAAIVDSRFAEPGLHDGVSLLIATYFYAFQIYCDFSGYSDIALGAAKILGYDLGRNFDRPYFAQSFSEYWTRWHISLSSWLRDYLYIPIGGNRHGTAATYRNLMTTMLLGGLWHGANWTFVAWGALHGLFLVVERALREPLGRLLERLRVPRWLVTVASIALVFHGAALAFVFFRAQTFADAAEVLIGIATRTQLSLAGVLNLVLVAKCAGLVGVLVAAEAVSFHAPTWAWFRSTPAARIAAAALLVWSIALLGTFSGASFIYFQF